MEISKQLQLVRPHVRFEKSYLNGFREMETNSDRSSWVYLSDDVPPDLPLQNFTNYVSLLLEYESSPPPQFVRDTVYWATFNDEVIGRISIRHELNNFLRVVGGHIGYIVRPSYRKRGIASEMLKRVLCTERARTIGRLLLTCDEGNVASEKTILKNGGTLENVVSVGEGKALKKRFWIQL